MTANADGEEHFEALVAAFANTPGVTPPDAPGAKRSFGSEALKVDSKIFAMLVKGDLVVKLPRQRVDALIAAGQGRPFDSGKGRIMKEWLTAAPSSAADWHALAEEAMHFVQARP